MDEDQTMVNPSRRGMDHVFLAEFSGLKVLLSTVVDDVKEIKETNKEIKQEVYGKDGWNGLKGKSKLHDEKLAYIEEKLSWRWKMTLGGIALITLGMGTQAGGIEKVLTVLDKMKWLAQ